MTKRAEFLELVSEATTRGDDEYGASENNFARIAALWTALGFRMRGFELAPIDVALAMILLKVARHAYMRNLDNLVDIAGYAACAAELIKGPADHA